MKLFGTLMACGVALALAGCGSNAGERALTGGTAGAVVGGPVGAVAGGTLGAAGIVQVK